MHSAPHRRARATVLRLLGATVAVGAVAGFSAGRADAALSAQVASGTLRINGDAAAEQIALRMAPGSPGILQVDLGDNGSADHSFDRSKFTKILVNAGAGDDTVRIDEANGGFTAQEATTINGQAGNDTLRGGSAAEALAGGEGDDAIFGARGDDPKLSGGGGKDAFTWNPGDGSDGIDGGDGEDDLVFNGSNGDERIDASASSGVFRLLRDVAGVQMEARALERVDLHTLGGEDRVSVASLASSAVRDFDIDLGAALGGTAGDGREDRVTIGGTAGPDDVQVNASGANIRVVGMPTEFEIAGPEATQDYLLVETVSGRDTITSSGNLAALVMLVLDGGAGGDTLRGGNGDDAIFADQDEDVVDGNQGADEVQLGSGNDTFVWDPGDGSDKVEGMDGQDKLVFNGSGGDEIFEAAANGDRLRFTRNLGNIVMDVDGVERIETHALGGADSATVNDLTGTDVTRADFDLAGAFDTGAGDSQKDVVRVVGTNGAENVRVVGGGNGVRVEGLAPEVRIDHSDVAHDTLALELLGGVDSVDASSLNTYTINLTIDAGPGDESLIGSDGRDTFIVMPGDGSDRIEGRDDTDTLAYVGTDAKDRVELSASGGRLRLDGNAGASSVDAGGLEAVHAVPLGGEDALIVNDLAGTGVGEVELDAAGVFGGTAPDGADDAMFVHATDAAESIEIVGSTGVASIDGLPALTAMRHADPERDAVILDLLGGNDAVDAAALPAGSVELTVDTGAGDDTVVGSQGRDAILTGPGSDRVTPGDGDDVVFLGEDDDLAVWDPGDDNDTLIGQAGLDTMLFNGSNASESIDVSANGGRVRFFRNVANVVMDLDGMERLDTNLLGGADTAVVNDLSGTDVTEAVFDLAGALGGTDGDAAADSVVVQGTTGDDIMLAVGSGTQADVFGLPALVRVEHSQAANDRLTLNALTGDDVIEASSLAAGVIQLTGDGGQGADVLIGSEGPDTLLGGDGDDVLIGGPGLDVLDGGPGDNVVIQD